MHDYQLSIRIKPSSNLHVNKDLPNGQLRINTGLKKDRPGIEIELTMRNSVTEQCHSGNTTGLHKNDKFTCSHQY